MAWKDKKMYSILRFKCPKCHEGDLFEEKNAYKFKSLINMPSHCPKCQENYLREPGFYFGAAYVSYGLTIALFVAVYVALITFNALGWIEYSLTTHPATLLITLFTLLILLLPLIARLSRSIWINMFVKYDPSKRTHLK
ncbi:MAG: DUF983 domain-containing protein [Flavobacteriales bacterium]|nr:DUF983 domain-containing protein [Flavobacteriales bacterium]MDG1780339.1 DUF983 domain-containing protein [Flavobacteriales bacterium]MDG2246535.1 DUF983 domain-containing protein [Flavobacteriales bacterium]